MKHSLLLLLLLLPTIEAKAAELQLGLSAVEEGNDTVRPAASVNFGFSVFKLGLTYYGRSFGPVTENTAILSFTKTLPIARSNWSYINAGAALIREYTSIKGLPDGTFTETSYAPAASLGIGAKILELGIIRSDLVWTTHVIPAGFSGIFLAHGRKQCFTFSAGVDL